MFNVGFGEIVVLAILGLLVFGPDRLPSAVTRGTAVIRQLRAMATQATSDIRDAAGMDEGDARSAGKALQDLHPKRWVAAVLEPTEEKAADGGASDRQKAPGNDIDPDLL